MCLLCVCFVAVAAVVNIFNLFVFSFVGCRYIYLHTHAAYSKPREKEEHVKSIGFTAIVKLWCTC